MERTVFAFGIATAILLALAASAAGAPSFESDLPFEVTAEEIEYSGERGLFVAQRQVRLVQEKASLAADWVAFSRETGRGIASGNVVIVDHGEVLEASFVEFAVDTLRGLVLQGYYDTGPKGFRIRADELTKTGDDRYEVVDGSFTTCRCEEGKREPWKIRASDTDMTVGGYAKARNTTIEVLGVPVLWLPWMIFPIKSDRESGLLFPQIEVGSRNGVDVGLPIFWAARDEVNVTFTPRYLTKRGFKADLDVDAVFGRRGYSSLSGAYLYDDSVDPDGPNSPFGRNRWYAKLRHDQDLPAQLRLQADLRFISDNQYVVDFDEMRRYRPDRFLESSAYLGRAFTRAGRLSAITSIRFADDLQNADSIDRDEYMLQNLPAVSFAAVPGAILPEGTGGPLSGFTGAFDVDFVNFANQTDAQGHFGIPDDSSLLVGDNVFLDIGIGSILLPPNTPPGAFGEGNGRFDEGEPVGDTGQRMVLQPRLAYPLRIADRVELYPEVGYQQTLYNSERQGFVERGLWTARADLSTTLHGRFDWPGLPELVHRFEPAIGWAYVSASSQTGNPLYIPQTAVPQTRVRQLSLDNVILDPADRIPSQNRLRLSASNRLYRTKQGRPGPLWADFVVSGEYDFADQRWGTVLLDGNVYPRRGPTTRLAVGYDLDQKKLAEVLAGFSQRLPHDIRLSLRYRYLRDTPRFFAALQSLPALEATLESNFIRINQFDVSVKIPLVSRFTLRYAMAYSFEDNELLTNRGGLEYVSKCRCWAAGVDVREDRVRGIQFGFRYTLLGLGDDRLGGDVLGDVGLDNLF